MYMPMHGMVMNSDIYMAMCVMVMDDIVTSACMLEVTMWKQQQAGKAIDNKSEAQDGENAGEAAAKKVEP